MKSESVKAEGLIGEFFCSCSWMKTGFEMGWLVWSLVQFGYEM